MQIISRAFGVYQTNCYIVKDRSIELIIDPGNGSCDWVLKHVTNPKAILITHGHFDHIFDVALVKEALNLPVYMPKDDVFMIDIASDMYGYKRFDVEFEVFEDSFSIDGLSFKFHHFPGHTPGCSMIQINDCMFSGDFLFKGSIGRWDFEFSNAKHMMESLLKCKNISDDFAIYPGHGDSSTLKRELNNFDKYLSYIEYSL